MQISSLFFHASTNESRHNIFQMARSANNLPYLTQNWAGALLAKIFTLGTLPEDN